MSVEAPPRTGAREAPAASPKFAGSLKESAKATRLLFVGQIAGKGFRFLQDLVIGRVLGPTGFGVFSACSSLMYIFSEIALLGVQRAVLRFTSLDEAEGRTRAAAATTLRGLAVCLVGGGAFTVGVLLAREPLTRLLFADSVSPWLLPVFGLSIPAIGIFSVLQFRARAGKRFLHDALIGNVARGGLPFLAIAGAFLAGWGLWGTAAGFAAGMAATAVLALGLSRSALGFVGSRETGSSSRHGGSSSHAAARHTASSRENSEPDSGAVGLRTLLKVSLPLALASASILLMSELDKVMLAIFRPESEVGIYNAAFRTARQAILVLPALNAAVSPWVAPLLAQGKVDDLTRLYRSSTCWSLAAGWSASLLFIVFGSDFLGLFGSAFVAGTSVLTLLALGQLVNSAVGNAGVVLQFSGNEKKELANGLLVVGLNVALNLALIPSYGPVGAAVATVVSLSLVAVRRLVQVRSLLGAFPYDRKTLFILGAGLLAALVAFGCRSVAVTLGGGAALGVAAAVGGMALTWAALLRTFGVSSEEAALLRLPRSWVKELS